MSNNGRADALRALRKEMDLSQRELAEEIDGVASTISQMERGEREVSDALVERVQRALGVDLDEYQKGNGDADGVPLEAGWELLPQHSGRGLGPDRVSLRGTSKDQAELYIPPPLKRITGLKAGQCVEARHHEGRGLLMLTSSNEGRSLRKSSSGLAITATDLTQALDMGRGHYKVVDSDSGTVVIDYTERLNE